MTDFPQRRPLVADLLVFAAGALAPLAFAPFGLWPLAVLLPAVLLWSWDGATPRRAAGRGGLFGLGMFGFGIYWIFISLHDYGNAPALFAVLATLAMVLVMALYPTAAGWLLARWGPPPGPARWLLAFPALWTLLDWVRSWLLTGFPWLAFGYSQTDAPLGQLAPYLGVFGVGWAVLFSTGLLWTLANCPGGLTRLSGLGLLAALARRLGAGNGRLGRTGRSAAAGRHRPGQRHPGPEMGAGCAGRNPEQLCPVEPARTRPQRRDHLAGNRHPGVL